MSLSCSWCARRAALVTANCPSNFWTAGERSWSKINKNESQHAFDPLELTAFIFTRRPNSSKQLHKTLNPNPKYLKRVVGHSAILWSLKRALWLLSGVCAYGLKKKPMHIPAWASLFANRASWFSPTGAILHPLLQTTNTQIP